MILRGLTYLANNLFFVLNNTLNRGKQIECCAKLFGHFFG